LTDELYLIVVRVDKPYRWHCYYCGRIMAFRQPHYVWTPFGGVYDTDPPADEQAHVECFEKAKPMPRQWIGPTLSYGPAA
jgi:hypothetical protein